MVCDGYIVHAYNDSAVNGSDAFTVQLTQTLLYIHAAPSSSPRKVSSIVLSSTEIQVLWTEVPAVDRNGIITVYEIMYKKVASSGNPENKIVQSRGFSFTINELEAQVTYNISVRALTSEGPGPFSMPENTVTTLAPRELVIAGVMCLTIFLPITCLNDKKTNSVYIIPFYNWSVFFLL